MDDFLPISQQIQLLFQERRHPETDKPYTLQEVSDQMDISVATLSQLRTGKITNPQLSTLREICRVFDVPLRYFETTSVEECYVILRGDDTDADRDGIGITFRVTHLSDDAKDDILRILQWIQAADAYEKAHPDDDQAARSHLKD